MPKPSQKLRFTMILVILAFISFVVYVSLLGENHRINALMDNYFTALKAHDYAAAAKCFGKAKPSAETHFLLELALLERYGLEGGDYSVKIERDRFWLPYCGSDSVRVSLRLEKKASRLELLKPGHQDYVGHLFTVRRVGGDWIIDRLVPGELAPFMQAAAAALKNRRLVENNPQGFRLTAQTIEPAGLSQLEKRVLIYQLNEAARRLQ